MELKFGDHPGEFPVKVAKLVPNERIELRWDADEGGWRQDPRGLKSSCGNCCGWIQMLCCLKGYVEHGINLRKGFF